MSKSFIMSIDYFYNEEKKQHSCFLQEAGTVKREKKIAGNVRLLARAENYLPQPTTEPSVGTGRDTHPSTPTWFLAQTDSQWGLLTNLQGVVWRLRRSGTEGTILCQALSSALWYLV